MGYMDERLEQLIETSRSEKLKPTEQQLLEDCFKTHPELRARWEQERRLSKMLTSLPDVPLSADFTEQVLRKVRAERVTVAPAPVKRDWFRILRSGQLAKIAAVFCILASLGTGFYWQQQSRSRVHNIASSLTTIAETADQVYAVSEADLEAIMVISESDALSEADDELWMAMLSY